MSSYQEKIDLFVKKYGHIKTFNSNENGKEYLESYVHLINKYVVAAINSVSFNIEGCTRPIDTLNQEISSHNGDYDVTRWSKSNSTKKNTVFEVVLYATHSQYTRDGVYEGHYSYIINFTMTDLTTLKSATFNNLSIQEFTDAVKEILDVTSKFIFNI